MIAAENDALPGGKVGGVGDVLRDVAPTLASRGISVSVVTPAYGVFAGLPGTTRLAGLPTAFRGETELVELYQVPGRTLHREVRNLVLDHPRFSACGAGRIYCDDPPGRPFATDASKFALFNAAVAAGLRAGAFGKVDVVHLHDWHAALVAALLVHDPALASLRSLRRVYTIHNLALQGIRPLSGDHSSLAAWFPHLRFPTRDVADPRWPDCVNPMAIGVRLAHAVHAVSPTYAEEIQRPNSADGGGFHGGEGLEADLVAAREQGRLFGILNGCQYRDGGGRRRRPGWKTLRTLMLEEILRWAASGPTVASTHFVAMTRIDGLRSKRPETVVTGVGRLTAQKVQLLREPTSDGRPALDHILELLRGRGAYVLLGSGDPGLEQFLTETAARHDNLLFLRGYSETLAHALYAAGDLFVMPSWFEPCGIGQMLAMREGQPCLVHSVGGLRDTVEDGVTGFAFDGDGRREQATALVARFAAVLELRESDPARYDAIASAAGAARFDWGASVDAYARDLYHFAGGTARR
jgi:starch synthase